MATHLPTLVRELTDHHLLDLTDPGSFKRGVTYHRDHRVINVDDGGAAVTGKVVGSGRIYDTSVEIGGRPQRRIYDACSCPLGGACKHVVALILAARAQAPSTRVLKPRRESSRQRSWEELLDEVIPSAGDGTVPRQLALVLTATKHAYGGPMQISVQPWTEGSRGGWIKTGVGWNDLLGYAHLGYGLRSLAPRQVATVRAIGRAAQTQGYGYYSNGAHVSLTALGALWAPLLREAERSGVRLMADSQGDQPVLIQATAVRVDATLTPPTQGQPAVLEVGVDLPDLGEQTDWHQIADAEHSTIGWAAKTAEGLVLVPVDKPVDAGRRRLLELRRIEIPESDWQRFALTRLPDLRAVVSVRGPDGAESEVILDPPRLALQVTHHPAHRSDVALGFAYSFGGGHPVIMPLAPSSAAVRDPAAETALIGRLSDRLTLEPLWVRRGEFPALKEIARFAGIGVADLVQLLDELKDDHDVFVQVSGEPAPYAEAAEPPMIMISATDGEAGDDWFNLAVSVRVGEEDVPLPELIAALAAGDPRLLLDSGTWIQLDRPELVQLASAVAEARMLQDKPSEQLKITSLHAGLWEQLVEIGVVAEQSQRWVKQVAALTDLSLRENIAAPTGLQATLRDYQMDGFRWLATLWDARIGGVLADDMGLGKTLQLLAMAQRALEMGDLAEPILIVCPTSVIGTWVREAGRFCPELTVRALDSTRRKAGESLADAIAGAHLVVTSFALLRIDQTEFQAAPWSALVLDEAQFVKNHRSKGYAAARRVPAGRTFALTGTPLENSLMDLWSLLSLTAPGLYPSPDKFKKHYAIPIERQGATDELRALRRRIRPLMLRRTKEAVATELPPKQETELHVPLAARHRPIYDRHLQRERQRILGLVDNLGSNRIAIFRALTMLRQLSLDPGLVDSAYVGVAHSAKIDLLVEHLHELAAEGHRALVFSQFTGFLRLVRERLSAEGISYAYLDGRTRRREQVVQEFRDGDHQAFLISLKAGGFGLTLTEADYVFVLDPWWNPAAEMQAIDRAHRIGQDKPVNVYRLVSADTIEEKVVALQQRKRDLFAKVVDDDAAFTGALTADDIRGLLAD